MPLDAPCKKGHVGQRSPTNRKCLACQRLRDAERRKRPEVRERYRASSAKWHAENKETYLAQRRERYAEDEAYREACKKASRDTQRARYATDEGYRAATLERTSSYQKRMRAEDEEYRARRAVWQKAYRSKKLEDAKYLARLNSPEYKARVAKKNAERFQRPEVKERHNKYGRAWTKKNRDKVAAKASRRRAEQSKRTPPWLTKAHYKEILKFYQEAKRLTEETGVPHQVDHVIPLRGKTVSGLHVPWNLQVLTEEENLRKRNRLLPQYQG